MNNLPSEVWHRIFIQLDLKERIKCTTICYSWWLVLDKYSLLNSIDLSWRSRKFTRFMDMIKRSPHRAAQVEKLCIPKELEPDCNKHALLDIFPNVRDLQIGHHYFKRKAPSSASEPSRWALSDSKIERLGDSDHCELAIHIFTTNLGSRLKSLSLCFDAANMDHHLIISQIKDLPVLKELCLQHVNLKVVELEMIHINIPSIEFFNIDFEKILPSKVPSKITPASLIKRFNYKVFQVPGVDTHIQFYQYVNKKYTNLTCIECKDEALSTCSYRDAEQLYQGVLLEFYRLNAKHIIDVELCHVTNHVNVFEAFDAGGGRLERVDLLKCDEDTLFHYLGASEQSKYIQSLTLTHTSSLTLPQCLGKMTALTYLDLCVYKVATDWTLNLAEMLVPCPPTLKDLSITCSELGVYPFSTQFPSIESLSISCFELTQDLGTAITSCFPNLTYLNLEGGIREDISIVQQSHTLNHISIDTTWKGGAYGFLFKSANETQFQYYQCEGDSVCPASFNDIRHLPMLSYVTTTEKKLDTFGLVLTIKSP